MVNVEKHNWPSTENKRQSSGRTSVAHLTPKGHLNIEEEDVEQCCELLLSDHDMAVTVLNTQ